MTETEAGALPDVDPDPTPMPMDATDILWLIESRLVPGDADGLADVRRAVRAVLSDWDLNAVADDVVLVASELVANALRHGCADDAECVDGAFRPGASFGVCHGDQDLTLFVCDPSSDAPSPERGDPLRLTGWGLELVAALSSAWGWSQGSWVWRRRPPAGPARVAPGKTVWATFQLSSGVR